MHTMIGKEYNYFHNGDYSGNVLIKKGAVQIEVPFEEIKDLVACWVMNKKISKLEQMDSNEILLGKSEQ